MSSERRTHARRLLYSPEYLDMGADNGGVVVNLSEGGLAFQAVGPVVPESEIPLSFSLGPGYRIDVKARVVWVNAGGKLGGAVFGKLSKDSVSLIREWLAKPDVEHESEGALVAPMPEREAAVSAAQDTSPVNPHPSAVAAQMADVLAAEELGGENGSELTSFTFSTPEPQIMSPPMPGSEAVDLEKPASPKPSRQISVSGPKRRDIAASPPPPPPPPRREPSRGASYSVAPSIAAWGRNDSHQAGHTPATRGGESTFPLRNAENIFARSSSHIEHERRRRGSGALAIFAILIAAGAVAAFYARTHRQQIGSEITLIGNTIAGAPSAPNTSPTPQKNATTANTPDVSSPNVNAPASVPKAVQTPPPSASPVPAAPSTPEQSNNQGATTRANQPEQGNIPSGVSKAQTPAKDQAAVNPSKNASSATSTASPYLGQAEYQRAENYLNGRGVPRDSGQAAEWFWRSLEAGDTSAAIPLADLYIAGDGVSRSCKQARILLDAAAQKNNPTAIKKLAELPENCE